MSMGFEVQRRYSGDCSWNEMELKDASWSSEDIPPVTYAYYCDYVHSRRRTSECGVNSV